MAANTVAAPAEGKQNAIMVHVIPNTAMESINKLTDVAYTEAARMFKDLSTMGGVFATVERAEKEAIEKSFLVPAVMPRMVGESPMSKLRNEIYGTQGRTALALAEIAMLVATPKEQEYPGLTKGVQQMYAIARQFIAIRKGTTNAGAVFTAEKAYRSREIITEYARVATMDKGHLSFIETSKKELEAKMKETSPILVDAWKAAERAITNPSDSVMNLGILGVTVSREPSGERTMGSRANNIRFLNDAAAKPHANLPPIRFFQEAKKINPGLLSDITLAFMVEAWVSYLQSQKG